MADKVRGIDNVLIGIPFDVDIKELEKRVFENTDPHIIPSFEELFYKDHSIRLLVMNVLPETPPYTTMNGTATIRQGKECLPYRNNS